NAGRAACWSNVPFAPPSIRTLALPRFGPTAVNQVTDPPAKANEAVAPARCSTAYEPPFAPAFEAVRQAEEMAGLPSSTPGGVPKPCVTVEAGFPLRSTTSTGAIAGFTTAS